MSTEGRSNSTTDKGTTTTTQHPVHDEESDHPPCRLPDHEVTWDGPDDPTNPYNWSNRRKVIVGIVCSGSQLITTMSASMVAPALDQILADLKMAPSVGQIAFSVFFLGLGFAPFLVAPLAETYGRKPVWVAGNVVYIIWNSLCPVGNSPAMMIIGRLLAASGCSVGVTLTGPVLADMYYAQDRGKSLAISSLLPYLGPALGPIVGGLAAQHLRWPWLFWILSMVDALFLLLGMVIIKETYAPVLLRRKALLREKANSSSVSPAAAARRIKKTEKIKAISLELFSRLGPAIIWPLHLMVRRPVIPLLAIGAAVEFGIFTIVLSTFANLFITQYGQSETSASLHYIAIASGAFITAQAGGRVMDLLWHRMKATRLDQEPTPEYRVPYIMFGLFPGIVGLFWYAWAAEKRAHWAVVDVGILLFTCGTFMFAHGLTAYQIDEFTSTRAASANAATRVWIYILGFAFPIFAPNLYARLGYGWGNSLLAFVFTALCVPITLALWFWGDRIRAIGRTAQDEKERLT